MCVRRRVPNSIDVTYRRMSGRFGMKWSLKWFGLFSKRRICVCAFLGVKLYGGLFREYVSGPVLDSRRFCFCLFWKFGSIFF